MAFYSKRGACEQYIKEGKGAIKWTRLSGRSFAANAVRAFSFTRWPKSPQLPAHAGDALADKALVYDHAARKADQDRREGRRSCALCLVPFGGGGHSSKSLRRHFAAHRRVTTAAGDVDSVRRSTFTRSLQTTGDMRLDDKKIRTFSAGHAVIIKLGLAGVCVEDSALPAAVEGGNLWLKTAGIR